MTDIETTAENARAQWHYPPIHSGILPSEADEIQLRLIDRLRRTSEMHALQVIADLGAVFDAENPEPAVEALGRLLVHAALVASCARMAIAPIIALGREMTKDSGVSNELPLKPASVLAAAVLSWHKNTDEERVRGLAMAIAKALDDCEIVHELKIDPLELFKVAAREVLDGVAYPRTSEAVAGVRVIDKAAVRAEAWAQLRQASEVIVADEQGAPISPEDAVKILVDGTAERIATPLSLDPVPGLAHDAVCPVCGAALSYASDTRMWTCSNGHQNTEQHLTALGYRLPPR